MLNKNKIYLLSMNALYLHYYAELLKKPLQPDLKLVRVCASRSLMGRLFHSTAPL